ncbi:MAG: hypothetical protein ABL893_20155 [Hyphomicrobium sp.]
MMIDHEIVELEIDRRVLVEHAFIVAGGDFIEQAKEWLANKLDATKRSQILFIDRQDILNLFTSGQIPLPVTARADQATKEDPDEIPF